MEWWSLGNYNWVDAAFPKLLSVDKSLIVFFLVRTVAITNILHVKNQVTDMKMWNVISFRWYVWIILFPWFLICTMSYWVFDSSARMSPSLLLSYMYLIDPLRPSLVSSLVTSLRCDPSTSVVSLEPDQMTLCPLWLHRGVTRSW